MTVIDTFIKDLKIIELNFFKDERGWFSETFNKKTFKENGINIDFIQDNHSFSKDVGVLRGLHFQKNPMAQTKLIRCTKGSIWDVAVDLRKSSSTYLKWYAIELSDKNKKMLLIPKGFAHGFITLKKNCEVQYKVDNYYNKSLDRTIIFNDSSINIKWPLKNVILSEKDKNAPHLSKLDVDFE